MGSQSSKESQCNEEEQISEFLKKKWPVFLEEYCEMGDEYYTPYTVIESAVMSYLDYCNQTESLHMNLQGYMTYVIERVLPKLLHKEGIIPSCGYIRLKCNTILCIGVKVKKVPKLSLLTNKGRLFTPFG